MKEHSIEVGKCHFSSRVPLVALGLKVRQWQIMETIGEFVRINQKTVVDSPLEKMTDGLITILAGGEGLVSANKLVGSERAVQLAFGRERCAEQSVISPRSRRVFGPTLRYGFTRVWEPGMRAKLIPHIRRQSPAMGRVLGEAERVR